MPVAQGTGCHAFIFPIPSLRPREVLSFAEGDIAKKDSQPGILTALSAPHVVSYLADKMVEVESPRGGVRGKAFAQCARGPEFYLQHTFGRYLGRTTAAIFICVYSIQKHAPHLISCCIPGTRCLVGS